MALKRNLHTLDLLARLVIGLTLVYLGFIDTRLIDNDLIRLLLGTFGVFNLIVAAIRHCPFYTLVGISTYPDRQGGGAP